VPKAVRIRGCPSVIDATGYTIESWRGYRTCPNNVQLGDGIGCSDKIYARYWFRRTLHAASIELCSAKMKDPIKDKLKRFGRFTRFGEQSFFSTLGEAVNAYLETHPVDRVDWEDRAQSKPTRYLAT